MPLNLLRKEAQKEMQNVGEWIGNIENVIIHALFGGESEGI